MRIPKRTTSLLNRASFLHDDDSSHDDLLANGSNSYARQPSAASMGSAGSTTPSNSAHKNNHHCSGGSDMMAIASHSSHSWSSSGRSSASSRSRRSDDSSHSSSRSHSSRSSDSSSPIFGYRFNGVTRQASLSTVSASRSDEQTVHELAAEVASGVQSRFAKNLPSALFEDIQRRRPTAMDCIAPFQTDEIVLGPLLGSGEFSHVYEIKSFRPRTTSSTSSTTTTEVDGTQFNNTISMTQEEMEIRKHMKKREKYTNAKNKSITRYAVKHLRPQLLEKYSKLDYAQSAADLANEAEFLKALQHPNIIKLRGISASGAMGFENGPKGYFLILDKLAETLEVRLKRWKKRRRRRHRLASSLKRQLLAASGALIKETEDCGVGVGAGAVAGAGGGSAGASSSNTTDAATPTKEQQGGSKEQSKSLSRQSSNPTPSPAEEKRIRSQSSDLTTSSNTTTTTTTTPPNNNNPQQRLRSRNRSNLASSIKTNASSLIHKLENKIKEANEDSHNNHHHDGERLISDEQVDVGLQISSALMYLHERGIMFRDLKPQNIGFDVRGDVKLFDFGLATVMPIFGDPYENTYDMSGAGSPRYMAPEVLIDPPKNYNLKADVYTFGIVLWQIFSLEQPYSRIKKRDELEEFVIEQHGRPTINENWPEPIKEVLQLSFDSNMEKRPSMQLFYNMLRFQLLGLRDGDDTKLDNAFIHRRRSFNSMRNLALSDEEEEEEENEAGDQDEEHNDDISQEKLPRRGLKKTIMNHVKSPPQASNGNDHAQQRRKRSYLRDKFRLSIKQEEKS